MNMKCILIVLSTLFLNEILCLAYWDSNDPPDTTPENFPFLGLIFAKRVCIVILIADNYVVAPGVCVSESSSATIYLGFRGYPFFKTHRSEMDTQIISSSQIFLHEDFEKTTKGYGYLNNIALVKLSKPAKLNNKIQPGKFVSRQEAQMLEGKSAIASGWMASRDTYMKTAAVTIRNQDTCKHLFGSEFLNNQEFCVRWSTKSRLSLFGTPVTVGNKLIGFETITPDCIHERLSCTKSDVFLNLIPYLDWLALKMNKSIEFFTSIDSGNSENVNVYQKQNDYLSDVIAQLTKEKNNFRKLEEKIENALVAIHDHNKKIEDIKIVVSNNRVKDDQTISTFQDELDNMKSKINTCLVDQESSHKLEAKFKGLNNNIQRNVDEKLDKLETKLTDINNDTKNGLFNDIQKFDDIINESETKQKECGLVVWKDIETINDTIKRIPEIEDRLQLQLKLLQSELKQHIDNENMLLKTLEKKQKEFAETMAALALQDKLIVEDNKKLCDQQQIDLEKHTNQEGGRIDLLWSQVENLNNSMNKINDIAFGEPASN